jgi:hypothetical protein
VYRRGIIFAIAANEFVEVVHGLRVLVLLHQEPALAGERPGDFPAHTGRSVLAVAADGLIAEGDDRLDIALLPQELAF